MSNESKTKTWERTATPGLLRHKSGRYYGRFTSGGKTRFVPLGAGLMEHIKRKFAEEKAKVERTRKAVRKAQSGAATMGDFLALYRVAVSQRKGISERTRELLGQSADFIEKTWPGADFAKLRPDEITISKVEAWRDHALTNGTGFRPPGSKASRPTKGRSASSFNKAFDTLRRTLDRAVETGAIHANILTGRRKLKAPDRPHKPKLPERAQLTALFAEIERIGGRGVEAADLCRFLAFTGCRLREAAGVTWADVDFIKGIITVAGTKTEAADREVPLIPDARALLERLRERRLKAATVAIEGEPYLDPASPVLGVREAQKSLTRACAVLGIERLTHHDLRDAFATTCIEAGVLIPTVAAWLGHADGGALLMRVYSHNRPEHSAKEAAKVSFA